MRCRAMRCGAVRCDTVRFLAMLRFAARNASAASRRSNSGLERPCAPELVDLRSSLVWSGLVWSAGQLASVQPAPKTGTPRKGKRLKRLKDYKTI